MPRRGGIFDKRSKKDAFFEGRRERKSGKQSGADQFFSKLSDLPADIFFGRDSRTKQERAYDAGHDSTTRSYSSGSRKKSSSRSGGGGTAAAAGGGILGTIIFLVVIAWCAYDFVLGPWRDPNWPFPMSSSGRSTTSDSSSSTISEKEFDARHWKIKPFTKNNNKTAPLLWAYRFSLPSTTRGCTGDEKDMWIQPNSVVFVRVTEGKSGTFKVGTPDEQRTVSDTSSWMAARFVEPGRKQHPADFQISDRKLFVLCYPSENMIVEVEARRLL